MKVVFFEVVHNFVVYVKLVEGCLVKSAIANNKKMR